MKPAVNSSAISIFMLDRNLFYKKLKLNGLQLKP